MSNNDHAAKAMETIIKTSKSFLEDTPVMSPHAAVMASALGLRSHAHDMTGYGMVEAGPYHEVAEDVIHNTGEYGDSRMGGTDYAISQLEDSHRRSYWELWDDAELDEEPSHGARIVPEGDGLGYRTEWWNEGVGLVTTSDLFNTYKEARDWLTDRGYAEVRL